MTAVHDLLRRLWPGEAVTSTESLTGGVSAQVTALTLRQMDGAVRRVVVREYGARNLSANPDVAAQEFALLRFLHRAGLPVPEPLWQESGVLVQTLMDGQSGAEGGADPESLAHFLARLHALEPQGLPLRVLPGSPAPQGLPDESLSESRIRAALAAHPPPLGRLSVLHGDLWPGNTLWSGGALSAVLDWEDAGLGDPLADVGNTRLELLFFHGQSAMQDFTRAYAGAGGTDLSPLPIWDLRAALRPCGRMQTWGLEAGQERTMRERHHWFVGQALAAIPAS
ncbi:phosphotransferase family protein [Deinococcus sp. KSM4-11]|uniref:phosphotransferase family protein n=1 Tax=Deinococcus sp. KSM4-11 TaxID=2568654 RepID=UPI0010A3B97A|nr:phosphotransferase [Deinococcus sp. KSM4-11]THF85025.1 phosphotransferase family protein [Deinococcus sp. KSM4-11]